MQMQCGVSSGETPPLACISARVPSKFVPNIVTARLSIADVMRSPVGRSTIVVFRICCQSRMRQQVPAETRGAGSICGRQRLLSTSCVSPDRVALRGNVVNSHDARADRATGKCAILKHC